MIWSRVWLTFLTLTLAAMLLFVLVMPQPMARALDEQVRGKLEQARQAGALLLRLNARQWIDATAQAATDAVLIESLEQSARGAADVELVHKTAQERLHHFQSEMRAEWVLATDANGRVIASAGIEEDLDDGEVHGSKLVAGGLRGQRGDDTWARKGRLFRVTASPVMARDRNVGVLLMGQEVGSELAHTMRKTLGVEVAFLLQNRLLASSSPMPFLESLPKHIAEHAAELGKSGSAASFTVESEGPGHFVMLSALPGGAGKHQALFAVMANRSRGGTAQGLLSQLRASDLRAVPKMPVAIIGGGTLLALVVGLLLLRIQA
jgi:hypothetical protein